jgi:flagellar hook-associated protein 3 FlgL
MISGTRYRLTMEINRQLALSRDIVRAQTEISTGKRIQTPSDDPVGAARVSEIARNQATDGVWKANLDLAFALASRADTTLSSVATAVGRASELMVAAANGTLSAENRQTVAAELRAIVEELGSLEAATDARGQALFPTTDVLRIPVGPGVWITAVDTRSAIFGSVPTASGPQDLAAIVSAAADAITEPDEALRKAAIKGSLDALAAADSHVAAVRGEQGARGNRIDNLLDRLASTGLQLEEERSAIESADVTAVVARLQAGQLTLQAAQAVFARVNQSTLFDVLR